MATRGSGFPRGGPSGPSSRDPRRLRGARSGAVVPPVPRLTGPEAGVLGAPIVQSSPAGAPGPNNSSNTRSLPEVATGSAGPEEVPGSPNVPQRAPDGAEVSSGTRSSDSIPGKPERSLTPFRPRRSPIRFVKATTPPGPTSGSKPSIARAPGSRRKLSRIRALRAGEKRRKAKMKATAATRAPCRQWLPGRLAPWRFRGPPTYLKGPQTGRR